MSLGTIVVGVDGREGGRDALALADRLRAACGALVAVRDYPSEPVAGHGRHAQIDDRTRGVVLAQLEAELARAGVDAEPLVVADASIARALHGVAQRREAALIVVGSAHRGRIGRVLAGDVASSALRASPCPVLVAPVGYASAGGELKTIGIAYDGSPASRAAAVLGRDLAVALRARLKVLTVIAGPEAWTAFPRWEHASSAEAPDPREAPRATLDALVAALGPNVSGELLTGSPAHELAVAADGLDLLVCGARAHSPLARLLLGSTSERLTHEPPCPVLVLPDGMAEHVVRDDPAWLAARGS